MVEVVNRASEMQQKAFQERQLKGAFWQQVNAY
jgi:hypothetical protein